MAADLFVVPTITFRLLYVLVIVAHERRRIIHVAVTEHPTAPWTAQQLRNAFPENEAPGYLLHDRDGAFAAVATTVAGMNIQAVRTAPRSPWQNAYVERVIGSIRRECLDHVIVVNATGLHRVLTEYVAYYMRSRTHLALGKDAPTSRPVMPPSAGRIVATPQVGGLHHHDRRRTFRVAARRRGGYAGRDCHVRRRSDKEAPPAWSRVCMGTLRSTFELRTPLLTRRPLLLTAKTQTRPTPQDESAKPEIRVLGIGSH